MQLRKQADLFLMTFFETCDIEVNTQKLFCKTMTRKPIYLAWLAIILLAILSCQKDIDENPDGGGPPLPSADIPLKDAQIVLPPGSDYDLSGHELMTFGAVMPVDKNGGTKTSDIKGTMNIAYLFDHQSNPVLAGFITDSTSTLSTESTAMVLLYYASGVAFMRDTVGITFVTRARELDGVNEWIDEFREFWKANPKTLATGSYNQALGARVQALFAEAPPENAGLDGYSRGRLASTTLTDILVDNNDIRSGLQVAQSAPGEITISNYYRRRAHAFLYKTKYKPSGDTTFAVIHHDVSGETKADRELGVGGSSGATSASGTVVKLISGQGMKFAVENTGPIKMELLENEDEAVYQLHIVGVGNSGSPKTKDEHDKKELLLIETFAFDFLLPLIGTTISAVGEAQKGPFVNAVDKFVKASPVVYDALNEGNFEKAIMATLEALASEGGTKLLEELGKAVYNIAAEQIEDQAKRDKFVNRTKSVPVLKVTDGVLQGLDWGLVTGYILASKQLENWELTLRKSQVRLEPKEAIAVPFSQVKLNAIAQNVEESQKSNLRYKWRTSGKYGYLIDTKGNQGSIFESTDQELFYNCNAPASSLGNENIEHVYVDVYFKGEWLGSDSTQINVQKSGYKMTPEGITLTGNREKGRTSAKLSLKPKDPKIIPPIATNNEREYKVVWSTAGRHGGLTATGGGEILSTVTTYDDNGISYRCTDDITKEGVETITARIYARDKNAVDAPFRLFDEVQGSVKINNDPKKKIIWAPMRLFHGDSQQPWTHGHTLHLCIKHSGVTFKQDPEAVSYSLTFIDAPGLIGAPTHHYWRAGQPSPYPPNPIAGVPGMTETEYSVYHVYGSRTSYDGLHVEDTYPWTEGGAEIIITLK
jgi:hypothetical protein